MIGREHKAGNARAKECYRNPPQGFTKLNFDGTAKGNPGEAGIRGIFRNDEGEIRRVFAMDYGISTTTKQNSTR